VGEDGAEVGEDGAESGKDRAELGEDGGELAADDEAESADDAAEPGRDEAEPPGEPPGEAEPSDGASTGEEVGVRRAAGRARAVVPVVGVAGLGRADSEGACRGGTGCGWNVASPLARSFSTVLPPLELLGAAG
jgi:hypothetical protein